ncbi:aspartate ammonia-lyase [Desulfolutivibrio sulfoxidireducens]|uniref:aspartate ammonia-lyase n=1 Tax=Desulfolutivibrio sulfoxidireducens TaxID=2773299 RepID=UPI00159E3BCE|nr:aspartate ammonia-lyase [Desulfolutivibrio sulfoxidireducens]QLA15485.1 aspartate ammonia-lyase [Desulfolutivibrio sulfoxidireducens]
MSFVDATYQPHTPECPGEVRVERDLLGEKAVPASAAYGIHTARALENFPLSGRHLHPELTRALLMVKRSCARANMETGHLPPHVGEAVLAACDEALDGLLPDAGITDALQGGAGTSANMNVNEVLANRAEEILGGRPGEYARAHPIHHVNLHQSTNDVFPTAIKVAAITLLRRLEKSLAALQTAFQDKEREFAGVVKMGRTQLQDACPITLGAGFSAYAEAVSRDRWRVFKCEERLRVVNLGGTAVGTGITAPREYIFLVVEKLREDTGLGLSRAENLVDATQNADCFVEVSGILKAVAVNLFKISSDLRLLASGPRAGLGEIALPEVQAGSSIIPGKVNPVICEAVGQAALRVMALDGLIASAAMSGQLELNAFLPLLADALLESLSLLGAACELFHTRCVEGIMADAAACEEHVHRSWATVVALVPAIGYEAAVEVARQVRETGITVPQAVLEQGLLTAPELRRLLSAEAMTVLGQGR